MARDGERHQPTIEMVEKAKGAAAHAALTRVVKSSKVWSRSRTRRAFPSRGGFMKCSWRAGQNHHTSGRTDWTGTIDRNNTQKQQLSSFKTESGKDRSTKNSER